MPTYKSPVSPAPVLIGWGREYIKKKEQFVIWCPTSSSCSCRISNTFTNPRYLLLKVHHFRGISIWQFSQLLICCEALNLVPGLLQQPSRCILPNIICQIMLKFTVSSFFAKYNPLILKCQITQWLAIVLIEAIFQAAKSFSFVQYHPFAIFKKRAQSQWF